MNKVLVIVVTYNGMKWIERCLYSVAMSRLKADIMVVDNGSTDGTPQYVQEEFPDAILRILPDNPGFGAANNVGMRYALEKGYSYVYLLNQDAWIKNDTLGKLVEAFEASDRLGEHYGVISPMQMQAGWERADENFLKYYRVSAPISESGLKEIEFVMAAHWMICSECLQQVGGFSPAFKQYGEDDNYLHRAKYHHWRYGVYNDAYAVHDRAKRQVSKEKRMNLKCVATVVKVSDPNACGAWRIVREVLELVGMSLKNASLIPLKYIPVLIKRYPELKRLREESKSKGAFL